jgi:two-component system, OmpR family, sensor histidine kinase BaeS
MNLSFKHKVFLTLLLNSIVIVICMLLIASHYAFRNFEEYVVKVERKQVVELVELLSREYRRTQSWEPLLDKLGHWVEMVGIRPGPPPREEGPASRPPLPPPFLPTPRSVTKPPGGESMVQSAHDPSRTGPPPPGARSTRFALFDAQKKPFERSEIASNDGYDLKPIEVEGQVVGWLGVREHEHPAHPLDVEFLRLQAQTFYSIGGVALVLAVLVTWALSRHLLAPVRELARGTRALTSRRFETRVEVRSGDELAQLASDFNDMAQALERYEQMRRQWIADISHELRTPLAILRGEIEAMLDGVREMTREALESLHFEVMHLGRIVDDLHDLSIIESESFHTALSPVAPFEVLDETLKSFQTRFEQRGITIEAGEIAAKPISILGDGDRLKQLFANILENTLRYALAPGVLKVEHTLTPDQLHLHFEDSGPGAPEESLGRLFDRLYRVDKARSRAQGGSGLGLAICRSIVESFGGRIQASNGAGGGLRISIQLPVYQ